MDTPEITATFDKDTFRCHRFIIGEGQAVKGTLYVDKDTEVPKQLLVKLTVKEIGQGA